jgi:hypothetical protein
MRTYDKLIATIPDRRSTRSLRACFGRLVAACADRMAGAAILPTSG